MNQPSRHLLLRKRFWLGILILAASAALGYEEFGWFGLVMGLIIGGVFSQGLIQSVKSSKRH